MIVEHLVAQETYVDINTLRESTRGQVMHAILDSYVNPVSLYPSMDDETRVRRLIEFITDGDYIHEIQPVRANAQGHAQAS